MPEGSLKIERIEVSREEIGQQLAGLRRRLSPRGDVVSEESRQLTIEVFGEPLSPSEVVQRICGRVREEGMAAVLEYGALLDGVELDAGSLQVSPDEIARAHEQASEEFLQIVQRVRENILQFQTAILHQDLTIERAEGVQLTQRYLPVQRAGLCIPGGAAAYPSSLLKTASTQSQREPLSTYPRERSTGTARLTTPISPTSQLPL